MRHVTPLLLALLAAQLVWAQDAPKRKSGLWEITRTSTYTQDKPKRIQLCVDQASDNALQQLAEGMRGEACTTNKLSHDGDKMVVDATCTLRDSTAQTHAVISGTFDSAYTVESKSTYKPPLAGAATGHAQLVARWTGPCAPNQHAGQAILDSGVIADSSGKLEEPKAKSVKPADSAASTHGKHIGKVPPSGTSGAAAAAKGVKPAPKGAAPAAKAKSTTPAATSTPPATNPKGVAPAATGTPPATNPSGAPVPPSTPGSQPAPSQ
jgi:hypothetical protein